MKTITLAVSLASVLTLTACAASTKGANLCASANVEIDCGITAEACQQALAAEANITSIPTLMAFREKVLVFAQPGALNGTQLDSVIDAVKALDMAEVHAAVAAKENEGDTAQ